MQRFIKWLSIFLTIVVAGCCTSQMVKRPEARLNMPEKLQRMTVALVMPDKTGKVVRAFCSGVWVDRKHIITAAHCVEEDLTFGPLGHIIPRTEEMIPGSLVYYLMYDDVNDLGTMTINRKHVRKAIVVSYDTDKDLAVLAAIDPPKNHTWASIEAGTIHVGEEVHTVGHVIGWWWTYHPGYISEVRSLKGNMTPWEKHKPLKLLQISTSASRGGSGGGAFNKDGRLVGIFSFINTQTPSAAFFVHRDVVVHALKDAGVL